MQSTIQVLIVEDDAETRQRLSAAIAADIRTALIGAVACGRDALEKFSHERPDVLLVDLGLPDMSGLDVIREAVRTIPSTDIMVITMFGDEAHVLASIEAGATGYLLKDCSDSELIEHIVALRGGGSPISPVIARRLLVRLRATPERPGECEEAAFQSPLTKRETEVLRLVAKGFTYLEVATALHISPHTITSHIKNSYRKLSVNSGAAAVARAAELGLLNRQKTAD